MPGWSFILRKNKLSADKECQWPVARCVEVIIMINESTFLSFANCKLLVSCAAVILVATTFLASANAQSAAVDTIQSANTPAAVTSLPNEDTRYRIGPGDVLTIVVRKAPDLSLEAVR